MKALKLLFVFIITFFSTFALARETISTNRTISNRNYSNNSYNGNGGVFYISNSNTTINVKILSSTFSNNKAEKGGAIANYENLTIDNTLFSENNSTVHGGGAIANYGTLTIQNGTIFSSNTSADGGAAIYNGNGTLNLIANTSNIEFIGNKANGVSNAIYDNGSTINLYSSNKANIIFNDRITSVNNSSTLNINKTSGNLPTTGKIILNEDMSGYTGQVNLYDGEIELQAKTEEGSNVNINKFFSGDINLEGGTLNILNSAIDNITVSTWTSTANANLKIDADLSNNTSDNFTVANSASGQLNLTAINIFGVNEENGQITLFNDENSPELNILTNAIYGGYEYTFTNNDIAGVINYDKGRRLTLKETVNETENPIRSYSLSEQEIVTEDLGNLGGTQLTIFGNGYDIDGNSKSGIVVSADQILNIENINKIKNFRSSEIKGTVICNNGKVIIDNVVFEDDAAEGGAVYNGMYSTMTFINDIKFNNNYSHHNGAAILNDEGSILDFYGYTDFYNNSTDGLGGAIGSYINTTSFYDNIVFSSNSASYGGALYNNRSTTTFSNGAIFINNVATGGGAINNNIGILNLIANTNNVEFTGNKANGISNAIHDYNGTINLWASENASAIFNDRITSEDNNSVLNINQSSGTLPIIGKVVLNEDMSGYKGAVNLYGGEIELQAKPNSSNINTNKFFSGNINLSSGTLNILNNSIDNITINSLTTTSNANLKIDADLSNNMSDNFTVANSASGQINLTAINILGVNEESGQITIFNNRKSPTLNIETTASYDGYEYTFTGGTLGVLNYQRGERINFKTVVNQINPQIRSYSLAVNEIVTEDLGNLGGTQLTIFGNGYDIDGNEKGGIIVSNEQILNIEGLANISDFNAVQGGVVFSSNAVVSIGTDISFNSNNATASGGALFGCYNSNIDIASSTLFSSNTATRLGGAIYIGSNSLMKIEDNVKFIDNSAKFGGAIANGVDGIINIGDNVLFTNNKAICENDVAYGGAVYNVGIINIGNNVLFSNNLATENGGAIHNSEGILTLSDGGTFINNTANGIGGAICNDVATLNLIASAKNIEFTGNTAEGISNAIHDNNGTINLWASENADIVFNDRITSTDNTSILNINQSSGTLSTNGKIILNEDMSGYIGAMNMYGGEIELQARTEEGSNVNINKFFSGDINLEDGTLNILNSAIDNITVSTWTSTANANLKIDTDLSNNISDNFTIVNSASGQLNLTAINILGINGDSGQITLFNNEKSPELNVLTTANYGGNEYIFTNSVIVGRLDYQKSGIQKTLKEVLNTTIPAIRSYSLAENELVTEDLGNLGGTQLTIFGNGYDIDGNERVGINTSEGQTLNIENIREIKNFNSEDNGSFLNNEGVVNLSDDVLLSSNTINKDNPCGGAINNNRGLFAVGNNSKFYFNKADGIKSRGGAICNRANLTIGDDAIFYSNETIGESSLGGAILNDEKNLIIGNNAIFEQNKALDGKGGALYNEGYVYIGSNVKFSSNIAQTGGAICNMYDYVNILDGASFIENVSQTSGGAIENYKGIINLIANTENIEFTGNTANGILNAIHDNGGTINLWASENADIIFHDRITSEDNSSILNINSSTATLTANGKIILNEDMSGYTGKVNLYGGEIELQARTEEGSNVNTNKFFSGNINLSKGTLNILNDAIDNITVSTWTSTSNANLKIDTDLSNNISDNFTVVNSASGQINLTAINILGINDKMGQITLFNDGKSPIINVLTAGNYGGTEYVFTNNDVAGIINYRLKGFKTFKETINDTEIAIRSYSLAEDELVSENLGQLGGTQLTIFGNGYEVDGNGKFGINVSKRQVLGIEKGIGENFSWKDFSKIGNGTVIFNEGITNISKDVEFSSNTGSKWGGAIYNNNTLNIDSNVFTSNTARCGGTIINYGGTANISSSTFIKNAATYWGGALENTESGILNVYTTLFSSNTATESGAAIQNMTGGIATIAFSTFIGNRSENYAGAIANQYGGTAIISSSIFSKNQTNKTGGAIHNDDRSIITIQDGTKFINNMAGSYGGAIYNEGNINIIANSDDIEFTGNTANGISNAIHNNGGTINLWASKNVDIIFNDRITSKNNSSVLNINSSTTTLTANGKIILNEDMSGYTGKVNLYGGEIELQARTEEGSNVNTNKFFSGNINLSKGTLNILNDAIDNITVSTWTSTSNANLKIDTDLSNNISDNFTVVNSASGQINLTAINILGINDKMGQITLFNDGKSPIINVLTAGNYGGTEYVFTNNDVAGIINYRLKGFKTFKETINDTEIAIRSYSLAEDELVSENLGQLGGTQLTIFGNNKNIIGNNTDGVFIARDKALNIENVNDWSGFDNTYGAIRNEGTLNIVGTNFSNNSGQDIINNGNLMLSDHVSSFATGINGNGNTRINGISIDLGNDAFMKQSLIEIDGEGTLTANASNVSGNISNAGTLIFTGGINNNSINGNGELIVNNELINNSEIIQDTIKINGNFKLGDNGTFYNATNSILYDGVEMDLQNNKIQQHNLGNLTVNSGRVNLYLDADLLNMNMDTISADENSLINGKINIKAINIINDAVEIETKVLFTNSTILKDKIETINTAFSGIYKYYVSYDKGTGTFHFICPMLVNPMVLESQVANISGLITQTTVLNQAFESVNNIRQNRIQSSSQSSNLYASTADVVFETQNRIESGLWIRPFALQHDIHLIKNSSEMYIDNKLTGTLAGLDLATGENGLLSFYLGYAGSEQRYENIKVSQTGYVVGATGMLVKNKWYAGVTANMIFNKAESENDYGTANFDMNMYSIGAKAGYNFNLSKKFILEPNLTLMYGKVNNQKYETVMRANINEIETTNILVEPQIKVKLNLAKGWQTYGLLGYSINVGEESELYVDDVFVDSRGIRGYGEYGLGVNKIFKNSAWSAYLEAVCRGGDIEGLSGNLGIKYSFLNKKEKENINSIKDVKRKEKEEQLKLEALEQEKIRNEKKEKEKQRLLEIEKKLQENYD